MLNPIRLAFALGCLLVTIVTFDAQAADATLVLSGKVAGGEVTLTRDEIAKLPQRTLTEQPTSFPEPIAFKGPSLREVLMLAGATGGDIKTVEDANQMIEADYVDLLGHRPDYAALQYYRSRVLDDRWTAARLNAALRASPEFAHRNLPRLVDLAYLAELGRRPDPKTRTICVRLVAARNWSESDLRQELRRSEEARRFRARKTVRLAYRTVLGREPDAVGMARYQTRVLGGWTLRQLEDRLARSIEYRRLHPQAGVQP